MISGHFGLNGDCFQCPAGTEETVAAVFVALIIICALVLAVYIFVKIHLSAVVARWEQIGNASDTGSFPTADMGPNTRHANSTWCGVDGQPRPWWAP